ncbi:hypothetical protein RSOLAG22IIIB_12174 [Rhizoctonia solani]|uniref:Protein kinase domain-containing protein n=1 Tax=Rhizoctonia solani TaxID=456999 RepID=A0A0K6GCC4_9AGAM|nr:hypothetical protein RSOLAG22IIIB_12174 [Rhizoctonia solani]
MKKFKRPADPIRSNTEDEYDDAPEGRTDVILDEPSQGSLPRLTPARVRGRRRSAGPKAGGERVSSRSLQLAQKIGLLFGGNRLSGPILSEGEEDITYSTESEADMTFPFDDMINPPFALETQRVPEEAIVNAHAQHPGGWYYPRGRLRIRLPICRYSSWIPSTVKEPGANSEPPLPSPDHPSKLAGLASRSGSQTRDHRPHVDPNSQPVDLGIDPPSRSNPKGFRREEATLNAAYARRSGGDIFHGDTSASGSRFAAIDRSLGVDSEPPSPSHLATTMPAVPRTQTSQSYNGKPALSKSGSRTPHYHHHHSRSQSQASKQYTNDFGVLNPKSSGNFEFQSQEDGEMSPASSRLDLANFIIGGAGVLGLGMRRGGARRPLAKGGISGSESEGEHMSSDCSSSGLGLRANRYGGLSSGEGGRIKRRKKTWRERERERGKVSLSDGEQERDAEINRTLRLEKLVLEPMVWPEVQNEDLKARGEEKRRDYGKKRVILDEVEDELLKAHGSQAHHHLRSHDSSAPKEQAENKPTPEFIDTSRSNEESLGDRPLGERHQACDHKQWVPKDTPISRQMAIQEVVSHLIAHGCQDLTNNIDHAKFAEHPVSHGGFSDIYRGRLFDNKQVAIKTLRISLSENAKHLKHAAREVHTWGKCTHPNILQLYGLAVFRGRIGMVSPWMENGNLPRYLKQTPSADRRNLCLQICDGLSYLHKIGIIHGDLKGANVLISANGTPVLADFGNSLHSNQTMKFTNTTSAGSLTVRWSAAELITGLGDHTEASDVYALGMTIYEILAGTLPYNDKREQTIIYLVITKQEPPERPGNIPIGEGDKLWNLLLRCWSFEPEARPSASDVGETIKTVTSDSLINSDGPSHVDLSL